MNQKSSPTVSRFAFYLSELKPKGKIITPFNMVSGTIILLAAVLLVFRFSRGLGYVSEASQTHPWGLWINFNVITGVAFAGGAFVVAFIYYILGVQQFRPIVRATILYGFLAYLFYAGALLLDLGRPWKIINPIIGNSFGVSSVLFLVAWHFLLYMISLFLEFSPVMAEWLQSPKWVSRLKSITLGVVVFGITLSTLHQSALGALFLMAKPKIHPLWYSEFIPVMFFLSSIFAGLSLIIIIEKINQKVFTGYISPGYKSAHKPITFRLARICSITMFVYTFLSVLILIHNKSYTYLNTGWGLWYLLEVAGLTLIPAVLYWVAWNRGSQFLVVTASLMSVFGVILNRLNVSMIAYQWQAHSTTFPTWKEFVISAAVIMVQIWVYRWIVRRMPIYNSGSGVTLIVKPSVKRKQKSKKQKSWKVLPE